MTLEESKKWFKEAKFGLMIHWGLYSLLEGEWNGRRMHREGEWTMHRFMIPLSEYTKLTKVFNPVFFNAEEWVKIAKDAGMQYMVVTSKHHDGFCLFDSEYDDYNCKKGTRFGRDIIGELAEACYKHNFRLGLYYSQNLDWHEENAGGCGKLQVHCGRGCECHWGNTWDFPDNDKKDFSKYYNTKVKTQVKEILTKYGDICLMWFDTPLDMPEEYSQDLYNMVRKYQPGCLVNTRIGNGLGDYRSCGDNRLPEECSNELVEAPITLNDTWGFKSFDQNWKDPEKVCEILEKCNSRGANMLLNVGPDSLGRFPAPAIEILKKTGEKMRGI